VNLRRIVLVLLLALTLSGCSVIQQYLSPHPVVMGGTQAPQFPVPPGGVQLSPPP